MQIMAEALDVCFCKQITTVFVFLLFLIYYSAADSSGNCPALYDPEDDTQGALITGSFNAAMTCFLDCTRSDEIDLICEGVPFLDFIDKIKKLADNLNDSRSVNIFLWSSPDIIELESGIFGPLAGRLQSVNLLNMTRLSNFPMLRKLDKLVTLRIENARALLEFSPELLPMNIRELILVNTGITILSADQQEVAALNSMKAFVFVNHSIAGIGDDFFKIFPNLLYARMSENSWSSQSFKVPENFFGTINLADALVFSRNNLSGLSQQMQGSLMDTLLENINENNYSSIDLSYNGLAISKDAAAALPQINQTESLSLAGNEFVQFFDAAGMFQGFDFLKRLDLSFTNVPKQKGLLRGLATLKWLNLANNNFRDLTRIHIFSGCLAQLETLDLSNNRLMALPSSPSFRNMTKYLQELRLRGNIFHSELLDIENDDLYPTPLPEEYDFSGMLKLDLSSTQLRTFKGLWMTNYRNLRNLDLSCNIIRRITKDFFYGLPSSLEILDISFCINSMPQAPKIEVDAFSTLGSDNDTSRFSGLKQLRIRSGYFKSWIFLRLLNMPRTTKRSLRLLDLSQNQIRYLSQAALADYSDLQTLNLGENFIQSIGRQTFTLMTSLQSLNLSTNRIVSIQQGEIVDLQQLRYLDLSNNGLTVIASGAFDSLSNLQSLYLGGNKLSSPFGMFVNGGSSLIHLGLQRMPNITFIQPYPVGCIDRNDLAPLTGLRYIYIDNSTAIFIDNGQTNDIRPEVTKHPIDPGDPYGFTCYYGLNSTRDDSNQAVRLDPEPGGSASWSNDYARIAISNPTDLVPRTFYAFLPKCYSLTYKFVGNATTNFLCPNSDSKTYHPNEATPASN